MHFNTRKKKKYKIFFLQNLAKLLHQGEKTRKGDGGRESEQVLLLTKVKAEECESQLAVDVRETPGSLECHLITKINWMYHLRPIRKGKPTSCSICSFKIITKNGRKENCNRSSKSREIIWAEMRYNRKMFCVRRKECLVF